MVNVGILGSGFIAASYAEALQDVRDAEIVAHFSRSAARADEFSAKWAPRSTAVASVDELCARDDVDLVVIALPNEAHLEAVRSAAAHAKGVICTKPLARTADEAAEMVRLVVDSGVFAGYAESSVFSPNVAKAHEMVERGGIGDLVWMRAREAHSGPHAPHFWDAGTAGGGALLDMGCHTVESARTLFGKDNPITEVMAWGGTLVHQGRTSGEDSALALLRFADGGMASIESSWIEKGGMQLRHEMVGTDGRIVTDSSSTSVWGFLGKPVGYLVEKADSDTGWVYPVPEETRVYGFSQLMRHFVDAFRTGTSPKETFVDGWVVNVVLDACYRSMRTRQWEPVDYSAVPGSPVYLGA
ncbi:Gfo/Idh/MocA family protein [Nakamurella endophytica]|uniref:Dehydrogenase n=1 Tax=Nakamurella endophytica TaxID=1748367 RepID=A0A917WFA7_9ACTN|nr:Gfo/Idh/MocA family oxidoreductase [Nakamurella endophytica]GGL97643.1 dehydrogenase [Nakamurella endophytica]